MRHLTPSLTYGRCRPCRILYSWPRGAKRLLRDARCSLCHAPLAQTAPSLLKRGFNRHSDNVEFIVRERAR